jgi:sporulation protein YlmC with PRC-barrel domain
MGYKVIDRNGALIGTASDYVLNMCEAHILYMVIETDPSIGLKGGNLMLVPYEVVTLGNGQINVDEQSIVLNLDANQVSGAPAITEKPDLTTTDWEQGVRDFWTQIVPLSNLTSGCRVSSTDNSGQTTVTKIAYASQILGTQLQTGTGEGLGQVSDVILVPESGLLRYLVLNPDPSLQVSGSILVPLRAVNINREAAQGHNQIPLVLLVEKKVLQNAPTVSSIPDVSANSWDAKTAGYWSQYVPMQQGQ